MVNSTNIENPNLEAEGAEKKYEEEKEAIEKNTMDELAKLKAELGFEKDPDQKV